RRHTRSKRDWSSDVCSSDLETSAMLTITAVVNSDVAAGTVISNIVTVTDASDADGESLPGGNKPQDSVDITVTDPEPETDWSKRSEERRVGKGCRRRRVRED